MPGRSTSKDITALTLILACVCARAPAQVPSLDSFGADKAGSRVSELEAHTDDHPDDAVGWYQLSMAYLKHHSVGGRAKAEHALRRAMSLDHGNPSYELAFADLLWSQNRWKDAARWYRRVLDRDSTNARPAYMIGRYKMMEFQKYIEMTHQVYLNSDPGPLAEYGRDVATLHFGEFGLQDREKAISALMEAIEADTTFGRAYYELGLIYLMSDLPSGLVDITNVLLKRQPGAIDAILLNALGHLRSGDFETANSRFSRALVRMDYGQRAKMEDIRLVASEKEYEEFLQSSPELLDLSLDRFWRKRDPLYLTQYNERRLEHYARVTFADERFRDPLRGIEGRLSDPGRSHIRFGPPRARSTSYGENKVSWHYEGFNIVLRTNGLDPIQVRETTLQEIPPFYRDPYRDAKYTMPHQVAFFREGAGIRVEFAGAVPLSKLDSYSVSNRQLENGLFVFDENWDEAYRDVRWGQELHRAGLDSVRSAYLLTNAAVSLTGKDVYHLVAEIRDPLSGSIGRVKISSRANWPSAGVALSDLLLPRSVEPLMPFPESRTDFDIRPNPLNVYLPGERVPVLFEIYNLVRDQYGRTRFEITYQIGPAEESEVVVGRFLPTDHRTRPGELRFIQERVPSERPGRSWETDQDLLAEEPKYHLRYILHKPGQAVPSELSVPADGTVTSVTSEYESDREDEIVYLDIDITGLPVGVYNLEVVATDVFGGGEAKASRAFRVAPGGAQE